MIRTPLHAPLPLTAAHREIIASRTAQLALALVPPKAAAPPAAAAAVSIPLTTVTMQQSFDAFINVGFAGADAVLPNLLQADSGNDCLVFPDYSAIAGLPGFDQNYQVIDGSSDATEPFGAPACQLRGPIRLPTTGANLLEVPDVVFWACTGPAANGQPTANFGTGCLAPRILGAATLQSPLACVKDYPCAEFDNEPALTVDSSGIGVGHSFINLYAAAPADYQMFAIIPGQYWMSLRPKALSIGGKATGWPGDLAASSLAFIDTGGTAVLLSDPENLIWNRSDLPAPAKLTGTIVDGSFACQATSAPVTITLGDDASSKELTYTVDTTRMPQSVQGLTLVACQTCFFMFNLPDGTPRHGMNIGGISALFNDILVDYAGAHVGFKAKPAPGA
jgi:hypothetical protein